MSCFLFVLFLYVEIPFDKLPLVTLTVNPSSNKTTHSFWIMACQPTPPNVPPEKNSALNKPLKSSKNENPLVPLKAGY